MQQQSSVVTSVVTSVGVSVHPLKEGADIIRIAGELPDWQLVAPYLGMGQQDIDEIEFNQREPVKQRKAFLRKWIGKDGAAATYEKLSEVLERLGERGAAEKIRAIASDESTPGLS